MQNRKIIKVNQLKAVSSEAAVMADFMAVSLATGQVPAAVLNELVIILQEYYQFDEPLNRNILDNFFKNQASDVQQAMLAYAFDAKKPRGEEKEEKRSDSLFQIIGDRLRFGVAIYEKNAVLKNADLQPESILGKRERNSPTFGVVYDAFSTPAHYDRSPIGNEEKHKQTNLLASLQFVNDPAQMKHRIKQEMTQYNDSHRIDIEAKRPADADLVSRSRTHRQILNELKPNIVQELKELDEIRKTVIKEDKTVARHQFHAVVGKEIAYLVTRGVTDATDRVVGVSEAQQLVLDEKLAQKLHAEEVKRAARMRRR